MISETIRSLLRMVRMRSSSKNWQVWGRETLPSSIKWKWRYKFLERCNRLGWYDFSFVAGVTDIDVTVPGSKDGPFVESCPRRKDSVLRPVPAWRANFCKVL